MEKLESGQLLICSTHQTSAGSQLPVGVVPAIPKAEVKVEMSSCMHMKLYSTYHYTINGQLSLVHGFLTRGCEAVHVK